MQIPRFKWPMRNVVRLAVPFAHFSTNVWISLIRYFHYRHFRELFHTIFIENNIWIWIAFNRCCHHRPHNDSSARNYIRVSWFVLEKQRIAARFHISMKLQLCHLGMVLYVLDDVKWRGELNESSILSGQNTFCHCLFKLGMELIIYCIVCVFICRRWSWCWCVYECTKTMCFGCICVPMQLI